VSVVISTYNRPQLLDRALASVYAQTFTNYEVIVVDDATPDSDTLKAMLSRWKTKFFEAGINLLPCYMEVNSGTQGLPKKLGIEESKGDYIAYLDDDNEWRGDHLATLVGAIESDFSTDMVYSRLHYVVDDDEARQKLAEAFDGQVPEGDTIGQPWNPQKLLEKNYIDTSTILHSRGAYWRMVRNEPCYDETSSLYRGWDQRKRRKADWNFVCKWAIFGNNARLVDKITVNYHWHKGCLQLTRPDIETPITFNYAQWVGVRKETDELIGYSKQVNHG